MGSLSSPDLNFAYSLDKLKVCQKSKQKHCTTHECAVFTPQNYKYAGKSQKVPPPCLPQPLSVFPPKAAALTRSFWALL